MKPRRASRYGLLSMIGLSSVLFASQAAAQTSPWQLLANNPPNMAFVDNPLLLTDGTCWYMTTTTRTGTG